MAILVTPVKKNVIHLGIHTSICTEASLKQIFFVIFLYYNWSVLSQSSSTEFFKRIHLIGMGFVQLCIFPCRQIGNSGGDGNAKQGASWNYLLPFFMHLSRNLRTKTRMHPAFTFFLGCRILNTFALIWAKLCSAS